MKSAAAVAVLALVILSSPAMAVMCITEWMYGGANGEFVEFTNRGSVSVDMTDWSFDDNTRTPGSVSLSAFGIVMPGESVLIVESTAAAFRTAWNLSASVKIIGSYTHNLGRADEINLYNASSNLVDRLTYDDQAIPGSIRTNNISGNIPVAFLGRNDVRGAVLSSVGDGYGSWASAGSDVGNPGVYIPEPATLAVFGLGALLAVRRRRQR